MIVTATRKYQTTGGVHFDGREYKERKILSLDSIPPTIDEIREVVESKLLSSQEDREGAPWRYRSEISDIVPINSSVADEKVIEILQQVGFTL